jgi:hypothetical protein
MLLHAAPLALLACTTPTPPDPIENIELCGSGCVDGTDPLDKTEKTVGDAQTFAWGQDDLVPPSMDLPGTTQRLIWTPSAAHQVLAAFDTDYSGSLSDACYTQPFTWKFVALNGSGSGKQLSETFSFVTSDNSPAFVTGQLIRYDRGTCRNFTGNSLVLSAVAGLMDSAVRCGICAAHQDTAASETREMQDIELHFTSQLDDIQHGVLLVASYDGDAQVTVNPAYVFEVDAVTGRLAATAAALNVVAPDATVVTKVEAALRSFATNLAQAVDPGQTNVLPFVEAIPCAASGSISSQQTFCSNQALVMQPGGSRAFVTLHEALLADHAEPAATTLANEAVAALTNKNFSCETVADSSNPECVMRLVYKRVYMLPDQLEVVFADAADTGLVTLAKAIGGAMLCSTPAAAAGHGLVPRLQVDSGDVSGTCEGCP